MDSNEKHIMLDALKDALGTIQYVEREISYERFNQSGKLDMSEMYLIQCEQRIERVLSEYFPPEPMESGDIPF